jgi:hypothetical protein
VLTLFTTPVIYLMFDGIAAKFGKRQPAPVLTEEAAT